MSDPKLDKEFDAIMEGEEFTELVLNLKTRFKKKLPVDEIVHFINYISASIRYNRDMPIFLDKAITEFKLVSECYSYDKNNPLEIIKQNNNYYLLYFGKKLKPFVLHEDGKYEITEEINFLDGNDFGILKPLPLCQIKEKLKQINKIIRKVNIVYLTNSKD